MMPAAAGQTNAQVPKIEEEKKQGEEPQKQEKHIEEEDDDNVSCESVNSDELDGELNSDEEDDDTRLRRATRGDGANKYKAEVDTNIFQIDFSTLKNKAELATGEPYFCSSCKAVFNFHSKIETGEKEAQTWTCEFCNHNNEVQIDDGEKPTTNDVKYILEAASSIKVEDG